MPHLIVEYSDNMAPDFDVRALLQEMHHALDGKYNIASPRIKARALKLDHYIVGDHGQEAAMVHVTFKLMEGRSIGARKELSSLLQQIVRQHVPADRYPHSAVTVEVVELATATYCP
ncbi:MAG: 5-carboxymethyl-2-hydroxymuconate Delta-isomerase [Micavibrio sp.]